MAHFNAVRSGLNCCLKAPFLLVVMLFATSAMAEQPQLSALVIGNNQYKVEALYNPVNDAKLIAETLKGVGFEVTTLNDVNRADMFTAIKAFSAQLKPGAISVVYFAGHGMQISGKNYLLPVDVIPTSEQGIRLKSYPLDHLLERIQKSPAAVNIVFLDACRNNPFLSSSRKRGFDNLGMTKVIAPRGTVIAYSTQPGQLAEDGSGNHSLYTASLSQEINKPGQNLETVLKAVAEIVRKKTYDDQQPWFESSLVDNFYFKPPKGVEMVTRTTASARPISVDKTAKRSATVVTSQVNPWYMQLTDTEWSNLDWEITQRVKRATKDEIKSLEYRAKAGNVVAQTTLGLLYIEGVDKVTEQGTARTFRTNANNTKSVHWLKKAADAGFPMAQVELGEMYYAGNGVDRDLQRAKYWYTQASRAQYPRAKLDLAQVNWAVNPNSEGLATMADTLLKSTMGVMNQQRVNPTFSVPKYD